MNKAQGLQVLEASQGGLYPAARARCYLVLGLSVIFVLIFNYWIKMILHFMLILRIVDNH